MGTLRAAVPLWRQTGSGLTVLVVSLADSRPGHA